MDREKVIKGIESCEPSVFKRICMNCPYKEEMNCDYVLYHDVIALLKEQETKIEQLNRFVNGFSRDAMPVVQCKDCRWGDWSQNGKGEEMILCYNGDTGIEDGYLHEPNWFCAEGERKEGR